MSYTNITGTNTAMPFEYITSDPKILGGKPCIRGTRLNLRNPSNHFESAVKFLTPDNDIPYLPCFPMRQK